MTEREMQKLLAEFRRGDAGAFDKLYAGLNREVKMFAYGILKDYALSEDVMQEVFLKLFQTCAFEGRSSLRTYLFAMARNLSLNLLRTRSRERGELTEASLVAPDAGGQAEKRLMIDELLDQLRPDEREVVLLKAMGFTHREIARVVGKPAGTVMWMYNDCKKRLQSRKEG